MSAYVMSADEIAPIVDFMVQHGIYFKDGHHYRKACEENANAIGQILLTENVRSVNARYREQSAAPRYAHKPARKARHIADHWAMIRRTADAVSCLDYQSCETDDWPKTTAFEMLARVNAKLVSTLAARVPR